MLLLACVLFSGCRQPVIIPDMDTAEEQYNIATQQYQDFTSPILSHRIEQRDELGRKSLAAFNNVITRFPSEKKFVAWSEYYIAEIYKREGKSRKALGLFDELTRKYPDNEMITVLSLKECGDLNDDLKRHEKAKECYNEVIKQFGKSQNDDVKRIVEYCATQYKKVWGKDIRPATAPRKGVK